ncbi:MAG: DUF4198 domain-containing protein [Deltaproteobacteria bacterium]|jgi:uncharacterized GH25 family protein|nr:DUF4198 domain-containing protein [Deltaproteobacteria bacterium]
MSKIIYLFLLSMLFAWPAQAHDFWAGVDKATLGEPAIVFLGFSDDFPIGEEITAEDYAKRYMPAKLIGDKGELGLEPGAKANVFQGVSPLENGTYFVVTESQNSFVSRTPSGPSWKSKLEEPEATACFYGAVYGKNLFVLGEAGDEDFIARPLGQKLEIVPQLDPGTLKPGDKFPVKVLLDGQPLAGANVGAFFAGFTADNEALAFSQATDQDGQVEIIPLRPGEWLAKVNHMNPYSDTKVCDRESYSASLAFTIGAE